MSDNWKCDGCGAWNYPGAKECGICKKPFGYKRGAARTTDPDTSHAAAANVNATALEDYVLSIIERFPDGCIAADVIDAAALDGHQSNAVTPRFAPLLQQKKIFDTGERRKGPAKATQRVVIAAKYMKK